MIAAIQLIILTMLRTVIFSRKNIQPANRLIRMAPAVETPNKSAELTCGAR